MQEITLRELDAQRARFAEMAERARAEGTVCAGGSARAALLARKARFYQSRSKDYADLLNAVRYRADDDYADAGGGTDG